MPTPMTAWRPTVAEVASVIPHRTGDIDGEAQGTFTATTVPTAVQVESVIRQIQSEVATRIGDMPTPLTVAPTGGTVGESPAGRVVAVGAAAEIERAFYPDEQLGPNSPASLLAARYNELLTALIAAAADLAEDDELGTAEASPRPTAYFPDTVSYGVATTPWERW